jgi:hypothetical protein
MATVTIAVDLAKNVFGIAIAGRAGTIRHRVTPAVRKLLGYTTALPSHHGGLCQRSLRGTLPPCARLSPVLLPPAYVQPYRRHLARR